MPGTITIQTQIGCDADEVIMTLSGTAEPNGGDHYATVDFTGRSQNIPLTSAGEQYTLRARGHQLVMNWPNIQFPYTVVALYAPAWAALDGIINGTPIDNCCIPTGESTAPYTIWYGNISGIGSYPVNPDCSPDVTPPYTYYQGCGTGTDDYTVNVTPTITIYDWVNKAFSVTNTVTYSATVAGVSMSITHTFTVSKVAGNSYCTYHRVYTTTIGGTASGTLPDSTTEYPGVVVLLDIPCSLYKIRFSIAQVTFGVTGAYLAYNQTNTLVVEFFRP